MGFQLLAEGFDVWLGNNRGNIYSRGHSWLSPNSDAYCKFSFFEMAQYDLPAMVDFVLLKTMKNELSYIGHSQGTAQMFAALA